MIHVHNSCTNHHKPTLILLLHIIEFNLAFHANWAWNRERKRDRQTDRESERQTQRDRHRERRSGVQSNNDQPTVLVHLCCCSSMFGSYILDNRVIQDHWIILVLEWVRSPRGANGAVALHDNPLRLTVSSQLRLLEVGAEFHCTGRNCNVQVIDMKICAKQTIRMYYLLIEQKLLRLRMICALSITSSLLVIY